MIQSIGIVGMGALGLLYAEQLTHGLKDGNAVAFLMDEERAKCHANDIYRINGEEKQFQVQTGQDIQPKDLVIVAVKYTGLAECMEVMAPAVGPDTIIVSVLNGVSSEKLLAQRFGMEHVVYAVAQGMDAMRDGSNLRYTQCGKLHIGIPGIAGCEELTRLCKLNLRPDRLHAIMQEHLQEVRELFEKADVPHFVEEDIMYRMWFKFMLNVGINQTCMVFDTDYGTATTPGEESFEKLWGAMGEVIPIARANGVELTEDDMKKCIEIERTLDPKGFPSMAQDRKAGRLSEVDMFAGDVLKMSKELGLEAPYNQYFYDCVEEIEKSYC